MIGYEEFALRCRTRWRFLPDPKCARFLEMITQTMEQRRCCYSSDTILFRAQQGCKRHERFGLAGGGKGIWRAIPHPKRRMKPRKDRAVEGRANPKGISVLYVATTCGTAIAEVRPGTGEDVTVSMFRLRRSVMLIDCSRVHTQGSGVITVLRTPSPQGAAKAWADIDAAFAKPVQASDSGADYAPTQVIAELFRSRNFDGVVYKSSLGAGNNIVLFDAADGQLQESAVVTVKHVTLAFKATSGSPFWAHGP